ncbi:MAG: RNA methyltransferase [Planctomycetales bacterium]|nr:RNA methyltransferase [Planctomycetales bacterium]
MLIDDLSDPRLAPFRDLKRPGETRWNRPLIAEGHRVTRRAFRLGWPIESVLLSDRKAETEVGREILSAAAVVGCEVWIVAHEVARQLVGFNFHAGVLAHLRRPRPARLNAWLEGIGSREPILAFSRLSDPENVGMALRNAAAFGVNRVLVGSGSADPLGRRALRLSMGAALRLNLLRTSRLAEAIIGLRDRGCEIVAAVCEPETEAAADRSWERPVVFLMGNESDGLEPELLDLCTAKVTIPLAAGVDSLNVATASAFLLYEYQRGVDLRA